MQKPLKVGVTRARLITSFHERLTATRDIILSEIEQEKVANKDQTEEDELCEICYVNTLMGDQKIEEQTTSTTVQFSCKHRFCSDCVLQMFE